MDGDSFLTLICDTFKCSPEDYNETVFWLCIFPQAIFLARWMWRWNRDYFRQDLELLEQVRHVTNSSDLTSELNDFRRRHPQTGFFRGYLKMRISGQLLLALGDRLFLKPG